MLSLLQSACANSAGMSAIQVAFIIGQSFLSTLCAMRWGAFVFYAAFVALAVVSVLLFIPETKVRPAPAPRSFNSLVLLQEAMAAWVAAWVASVPYHVSAAFQLLLIRQERITLTA